MLLDGGGAELADDRFEVYQNADALSLDVLDNDAFPVDYPGLREITSVSYGSEGGRVEIGDGADSIRYVPPADFDGDETFVYYVDNQLSATVTVEVLPLLADDSYSFPPDGDARVLGVLGNDPFWPGYGGEGRITAVSETALGAEVEIAADGKSLVYTPSLYMAGKDTFVYVVDDLYPADVQVIIINPVGNDSYPGLVQSSENNLLDVLADDHFWPGYAGARMITHVSEPSRGGTVTIAADGQTLSYTPEPDRAGYESFQYVVDGLYEAHVSVQVHRPVRDNRVELDRGSVEFPIDVTDNDWFSYRVNNQRIVRDVVDRVTSVGETAEGGTVEIMPGGQEILYSAPPDFEGLDSFEYIADGKYRATVRVDVTRPVRYDYFGQHVYEDTVNNSLDVLANDFLGNGYQGSRTITAVGETTDGGTVSIAAGGSRLIYTPPEGFRGNDHFTYTVADDLTAEVTVRMLPLTTRDSYRYEPYPAPAGHTLYVLANDHFGGNYPGAGRITSVGETANGGLVTIEGNGQWLRFVSAEGGSDSFTYTVDGKYTENVSVYFYNYLRGDDFPVDQNSNKNVLYPLTNDFRGSVYYSGPRQITSVGTPEQGGTVSISEDGKSVIYTPAADFAGTDRFTYTVDGMMRQTVEVPVVRRVRDDVYRVEPDSAGSALTVLVNDMFGANYTGAGRITGVTATDAGAAVAVASDGGSIQYTPPAGFSGEDTFGYTVDGALKAAVTVHVSESVEDTLPRFDDPANVAEFLLEDALQRYAYLFGMGKGSTSLPPGFGGQTYAFSGDGLAPTERVHSETNVQVAGVDEGDIIEVDDDYIYILTDSELIIADAWPAEEMSIASRTAIEGEPVGMYLHGDRLTVVSKASAYPWLPPYDDLGGGIVLASLWWPQPQPSETYVTVLDVSDREVPDLVEQTKLDGRYVESRRIDDSVFLVLRDNDVDGWLPRPELLPTTEDPEGPKVYETEEQYIARVTAEIETFLPQATSYDADGEVLQTSPLHVAGELFRPFAPDAERLVTVVSMNIADDQPGIVASTGLFTGGASEIYGSLENLFVFDQEYTAEDGGVLDILEFDWDAETGNVEFAAKGRVPGRMVDQFSADEFDGHLRIATTINNSYAGNWSGRSENVLFVLRNDAGVLEYVGGIQNLALDESIRSVRFMGDRGFVTTFRDIDPLFAVDLSDPAKPRAVGHVTMPGFNSYMQLIDADHLLTVGRNTPVGRSGPTQVALFDVSDLSQPRLIDQYTFDRFSTSEAEVDHHAFGWFAHHNVLSMPSARVYQERVDENGDGYGESRRTVREDELMLFTIDVTATRESGDGIQLLGELPHDSPVRRSGFIDNVLYTVAEESATAVNIEDPTHQYAAIEFPSEQDDPKLPPWPWPVWIIDDGDAGFRTGGEWIYHPAAGLAEGIHFGRSGGGEDTASWSFPVTPGLYRVAATWPDYVNQSSDAPFDVRDGSTTLETVRLNQQSPPDDFVEDNVAWESLGIFEITGNQLVVALSDDADQYVIADAVRVEAVSPVVGRYVFYGNSAFGDPADAIATDKTPLLPGQTATFANYTNYSRGINGVMVDVYGMAAGATPSEADFEFKVGNNDDPDSWTQAPAPSSVTFGPGEGVDGTDRITVTWSDGVIRNQWLEVTVLADGLGIPANDVFYFGNAIGDAGNSTTDAMVTTTDLLLARNNPRNFLDPAGIDLAYDYNHDQRVNVTDVLLARNNQTNFLTALRLIDLSSLSSAEAEQPEPAAEAVDQVLLTDEP